MDKDHPVNKVDIARKVLAAKNINENFVTKSRSTKQFVEDLAEHKAKKRALFVKPTHTRQLKTKISMDPVEVDENFSNKFEIKGQLQHTLFKAQPGAISKRTLRNSNNSFMLHDLIMGSSFGEQIINANKKRSSINSSLTHKITNDPISINSSPLTDKLIDHQFLSKPGESQEKEYGLDAKKIAILQREILKIERDSFGLCSHSICQKFLKMMESRGNMASNLDYDWEFRCTLFHDMELFENDEAFQKGNIRQMCYFNTIYKAICKTSNERHKTDDNWSLMNTIVDDIDEFPFSKKMMVLPEVDKECLEFTQQKESLNELGKEFVVHITSFNEEPPAEQHLRPLRIKLSNRKSRFEVPEYDFKSKPVATNNDYKDKSPHPIQSFLHEHHKKTQ